MKCPKCGSKNTAKYIYGMPVYSDDFEKKLKAKKIRIGGCCIGENNPKYHCNTCYKDFGKEAYWIDRRLQDAGKYVDTVTRIEFEYGGFFDGYKYVCVEKRKNGALLQVRQPFETDPSEVLISEADWKKLMDKVFHKLYLAEWKKNYVNPTVLDGEQWSISLQLTNNRKRNYYGSNDYPPYWPECKKLIDNLMERAIESNKMEDM